MYITSSIPHNKPGKTAFLLRGYLPPFPSPSTPNRVRYHACPFTARGNITHTSTRAKSAGGEEKIAERREREGEEESEMDGSAHGRWCKAASAKEDHSNPVIGGRRAGAKSNVSASSRRQSGEKKKRLTFTQIVRETDESIQASIRDHVCRFPFLILSITFLSRSVGFPILV